MHIEAIARKSDGGGEVEKRLDWTFSLATRYADCKGNKAGKETDGVLVTNGGTDDVELTIHGDHFFYDDLQAATAARRFAPIAAADADDDGAVTLEELAAVRLVAIKEGTYGTGSAGNINDLGAFVAALSRTNRALPRRGRVRLRRPVTGPAARSPAAITESRPSS